MPNPHRYSIMTIAGVIIYTATLAALVVLTLRHEDTEAVMVLAGPVVAALLVSGQIGVRADRHDDALDRISRQTNGVLDQRIRDGVRAVLDDRPAP